MTFTHGRPDAFQTLHLSAEKKIDDAKPLCPPDRIVLAVVVQSVALTVEATRLSMNEQILFNK